MSLGIYFRKFLNLDSNEDYVFLETKEYNKFDNKKIELSGTNTIKGDFQEGTVILLSNNANLQIDSEFNGKIVGKGNNIIRINNKVSGQVVCEKLILLNNGFFDGKGWCGKLILCGDSLMTGVIRMGLMNTPYHNKLADLTINDLRFFEK